MAGDGATAQRPRGCTLAAYAEAKQLPVEFLADEFGISEISYLDAPAVRMPYVGADGEVVATRYRVALEGEERFRFKNGSRPCLYGLPHLRSVATDWVLLVEGESDVQTARLHGIPAVGVPGASGWNDGRDAPALENFGTVFLVLEPDGGGERLRSVIEESSIRAKVRVVDLGAAKDLSELHLRNPSEFKPALEAALAAALPLTARAELEKAAKLERARAVAGDLLGAERILDRFADEVRRAGLVGEADAAKIIFLALITRLFETIVSVVIKGHSAAGKSFLLKTVLRFFPDSAYYPLTTASEKALIYTPEPFSHRHLVIYEAPAIGDSNINLLIRTLMSEGRIIHEVTVEKPGGGFTTQRIEKTGPTGLLTTTTEVALHGENETRLLSVSVTDTPEQTAAVLRQLAEDEGPDADLAPFHALQELIAAGGRRVVILFAAVLMELIPPIAIRLRRDVPQLLQLVRAHALLHQETRERDEQGRIIATLDDYEIVRDLMADILGASVEASVRPEIRDTVMAVRDLTQSDEGLVTVGLSALARKLELHKSTVSRRVRVCLELGYLRNHDYSQGKSFSLETGDPLPEDQELLPTRATLERLTVASSEARSPDPPPSAAETAVLAASRPGDVAHDQALASGAAGSGEIALPEGELGMREALFDAASTAATSESGDGPVCRFASHRDSVWHTRDGRRVCGICHPSPDASTHP